MGSIKRIAIARMQCSRCENRDQSCLSISMITKGGLQAVTRSLAMEYVKQGIRVNAVAPGIVDTPMHKDDPKDFLKTLQPMGQISDVKDIVDAIVDLT